MKLPDRSPNVSARSPRSPSWRGAPRQPDRYYTLPASPVPASDRGGGRAGPPHRRAVRSSSWRRSPCPSASRGRRWWCASRAMPERRGRSAGAAPLDLVVRERIARCAGRRHRGAARRHRRHQGRPPAGTPAWRIAVQLRQFDAVENDRVDAAFGWTVRRADRQRAAVCRWSASEPVGAGIDALAQGAQRVAAGRPTQSRATCWRCRPIRAQTVARPDEIGLQYYAPWRCCTSLITLEKSSAPWPARLCAA